MSDPIEVPRNAPVILAALNTKLLQLQLELETLIEAARAYAYSVGLDSTKNYRFEFKSDVAFAFELDHKE